MTNDEPVKYLAFDPGYTTGYYFFSNTGVPQRAGQLEFCTMITGLHNMIRLNRKHDEKLVFIIEDFQLLSHKAQSQIGSRFETCQVIGALKLTAELLNADIVIQSPTIKNAASGWTGIKPKGPHNKNHWVDAQLHGFFYLINNNILTVSQVRSRDWNK